MIALYSDLHINTYGNRVNAKGENIRLLDVLNVQDQIFQYVLEHEEVKNLWFLGDLFDPRNKIPVPALSMASLQFNDFFNRINGRSLTMYYMAGNHDMYIKGQKDQSINFLLGRVNIVDKPIQSFDEDNKVVYGMIPYCVDRSDFISKLEPIQIQSSWRKVLLIHQTIKGCKVGPDNYQLGDEGVSIEDLEGFDLIISGHIHKPQELDGGRIVYIGSPLQLSWGEATEHEKGFLLLDPKTLEYKRINLEFPHYYTVEADRPELAEHVITDLLSKGVRRWMIKVKTTNENVALTVSNMDGIDISYTPNIQVVAQESIGEELNSLSVSISSNEELISNYLKQRGVDDPALSQLGVELLNLSEESI